MIQKLLVWIQTRPRHCVLYGLLFILVGLLLLQIINSKNWRPLKTKADWDIHSNYSQTLAALAIDQNLDTAWSSYAPMAFGMFMQVDLRKPERINGLLLRVGKDRAGQPEHWIIKTSLDKQSWQAVRPHRTIRYRAMLANIFAPVEARYVQIISTGGSASGDRWLINELDILQPLFPWQFEESAIIWAITGCCATLILTTAFVAPNASKRETLLLLVLAVLILTGWIVRVYNLDTYEISERESAYLAMLDLADSDHLRWSHGYFENTEAGASWLTLLTMRIMYQLLSAPILAIRSIPALATLVLLVFGSVVWRLRRRSASEKDSLSWLVFPGLVSVALLPIWFSRHSEPALVLLLVWWPYAQITYTCLQQHASYLWLASLPCLLIAGYFAHPAMAYVPPGILLFGLIALLWQHFFSAGTVKSAIQRFAAYCAVTLSLYLVWMAWLWRNSPDAALHPIRHLSLPSPAHLMSAAEGCGISGIALWPLIILSAIGLLNLLLQRQPSIYFWGLQVIVVILLAEAPLQTFLVGMMILICLARGTILVAYWLRNTIQTSWRWTPSTLIAILWGYMLVFSLNTLFWGNLHLPLAATYSAQAQQEAHFAALLDHIHDDPDACATTAFADDRLTEFLTVQYGLDADFVEIPLLQELAQRGRIWHYLFLSLEQEAFLTDDEQDFLQRMYTKGGESTRIALYQIRTKVVPETRRYLGRELFRSTGRHDVDDLAFSDAVRIATPDDPPGLLAFGLGERFCTHGCHIARFVLRSDAVGDDVVAILEVVANKFEPLARLELTGRDFQDASGYHSFDLHFDLDMEETLAFQVKRLDFMVHVTGAATVSLDYVDVFALHKTCRRMLMKRHPL